MRVQALEELETGPPMSVHGCQLSAVASHKDICTVPLTLRFQLSSLGLSSVFGGVRVRVRGAGVGVYACVWTIISEVSRYYGEKPAALKAVRRGIENEPRDVAMYLIRSMRSEPLIRVGVGFGLNRYSSVSSAVRRVKTKLQEDRKFKTRLEHIESNILKGQT